MAARKPRRRRPDPNKRVRNKPCAFCQENATSIDWKDVSLLRKYMSDRGKIRARRINGNCEQHQKLLSKAIKNAREMALLPYLNR